MATIGYARISTREQKLDLQIDALRDVGCETIFTDTGVSGAQKIRPGLEQALTALGPEDTLVVWRLDRLGRSVQHLSDLLARFHMEEIEFRSLSEGIDTATMTGKLVFHIFSAIGEFERDLIRERTISGMAAAKRRGKHVGRPPKLSKEDRQSARRSIRDGANIDAVAEQLGVSVMTLKRTLKTA